MSNDTSSLLRGLCPAPFYDASKFDLGGCKYTIVSPVSYILTNTVVDGRFCAPVPIAKGLVCCLPCPMTDYLYPSGTFPLQYVSIG
jgi:hypothetical protein